MACWRFWNEEGVSAENRRRADTLCRSVYSRYQSCYEAGRGGLPRGSGDRESYTVAQLDVDDDLSVLSLIPANKPTRLYLPLGGKRTDGGYYLSVSKPELMAEVVGGGVKGQVYFTAAVNYDDKDYDEALDRLPHGSRIIKGSGTDIRCDLNENGISLYRPVCVNFAVQRYCFRKLRLSDIGKWDRNHFFHAAERNGRGRDVVLVLDKSCRQWGRVSNRLFELGARLLQDSPDDNIRWHLLVAHPAAYHDVFNLFTYPNEQEHNDAGMWIKNWAASSSNWVNDSLDKLDGKKCTVVLLTGGGIPARLQTPKFWEEWTGLPSVDKVYVFDAGGGQVAPKAETYKNLLYLTGKDGNVIISNGSEESINRFQYSLYNG